MLRIQLLLHMLKICNYHNFQGFLKNHFFDLKFVSHSWNSGFIGYVNDLNVAAGSAQDSNCLLLITIVISFVRQRFQNEGNEQKKDDCGAEN
jgi:hypothetical protein